MTDSDQGHLGGSDLYLIHDDTQDLQSLSGQQVGLRIVKVRTGRPPLVRVVMSSSTRLDESHVDALKQLISERVGRVVLVEAQLNLRR